MISLMIAELVDAPHLSYLCKAELGIGDIPKNTLARAR
jgi:hypothetical protein